MLVSMEFIHQPVHGGSVSNATRYSIRLLCVANLAVIPFRGIAVRVKHCQFGKCTTPHDYYWHRSGIRIPLCHECYVMLGGKRPRV